MVRTIRRATAWCRSPTSYWTAVLSLTVLLTATNALNDHRRNLSFHIPGDTLDLQSLYLETTDYSASTVALTPMGCVTRNMLHELIPEPSWYRAGVLAGHPNGYCDLHEWMLDVSRRMVRDHLAPLLCKVMARFRGVSPNLEAAGGVRVGLMSLDLEDLGYGLGLTELENNHAVRKWQQESSVKNKVSGLEVFSQKRSTWICSFDPTYLHQGFAA